MNKLQSFINRHKTAILLLVAVILLLTIFLYVPEDVFECKHTSTETHTTSPACTKAGKNDVVCSDCGIILDTTEIPFAGHSFGEWTEVAKPSSKEDGLRSRKCLICGQIEQETIPYVFVSSSPEIELSYEYVSSDEFMPYGLITPSSAKDNNGTPLIVSLHGSGEIGCSGSEFKNKYVMKAMRNWKIDGFNAYVLFPHLSGNAYSKYWNGKTPSENVFKLIDFI